MKRLVPGQGSEGSAMIERRFMQAELECAEDRCARRCLQPSDSENRKAAPRPFSSPSTRYHGRYYDRISGKPYLAKCLISLVGAPGLEPETR